MPRSIILDHDGSVDDMVALLLTLTAPGLDASAVVVTSGDCYGGPALEATSKLCHTFGVAADIGLSGRRAVNAFPPEWRRDSYVLNELPALNRVHPVPVTTTGRGEDVLVRALERAVSPVTLIVTGPLSNLAFLIESRPDLLDRIEEVVWMGGALEVAGNVEKHHELAHDGSAEWNAYWDPMAVQTVLHAPLRLVVVPLDVTNDVRLNPDFLDRMRQAESPAAQLVSQAYSLVCFREYYIWDVATVASVVWPELFTTKRLPLAVQVEGSSQGRIAVTGDRIVDVVMSVDSPALWQRLEQLWAS